MNITDKLKLISEQDFSQDPDNLEVLKEWNTKLNEIGERKDYAQLTETKRITSYLKAQIDDINAYFEGLTVIDDKDAINAKLALRTAYKSLLNQFYTEKMMDKLFDDLNNEIDNEITKLNL